MHEMIGASQQFAKFLHSFFTHCRHELLILSETLIDFRRRFHRSEYYVSVPFLAINSPVRGPVSIGNLLVSRHHHLGDAIPVRIMPGTDTIKGNLKIAHVWDIDLWT